MPVVNKAGIQFDLTEAEQYLADEFAVDSDTF